MRIDACSDASICYSGVEFGQSFVSRRRRRRRCLGAGCDARHSRGGVVGQASVAGCAHDLRGDAVNVAVVGVEHCRDGVGGGLFGADFECFPGSV